jgi:hypothetical protein
MKKPIISLIVVAILSILSGCGKEKSVEVVQTVDWYKANKIERLEVLAKCKNNPGELANKPNCINARSAANSITHSARGGINVKPLTADEINNR